MPPPRPAAPPCHTPLPRPARPPARVDHPAHEAHAASLVAATPRPSVAPTRSCLGRLKTQDPGPWHLGRLKTPGSLCRLLAARGNVSSKCTKSRAAMLQRPRWSPPATRNSVTSCGRLAMPCCGSHRLVAASRASGKLEGSRTRAGLLSSIPLLDSRTCASSARATVKVASSFCTPCRRSASLRPSQQWAEVCGITQTPLVLAQSTVPTRGTWQ